jgi:hypothetical protein
MTVSAAGGVSRFTPLNTPGQDLPDTPRFLKAVRDRVERAGYIYDEKKVSAIEDDAGVLHVYWEGKAI